MLLETAPSPRERILTQLSNILPQQGDTSPLVAPHTSARDDTQKLYQGDMDPLIRLEGRGVAIWCPDHRILGKTMAAYARHPTNARPLGHIRFITPMDLLPGCHTPQTIQDIFYHPLLGKKWAHMVRRTEYVTHPVTFIASGNHGPITLRKGLFLATVSQSLNRIPATTPLLAEPLFRINQGVVYYLDCSADTYHRVLPIIADTTLMLDAHHGHPTRSPSSTVDTPRLRLGIYFPTNVPEIDAALIMNHIRHHSLPRDTIVGSTSLFSDRDALLMEATTPSAPLNSWHLCSEMIYVAPKTVLIKTQTSVEAWRAHMDTMLREDPTAAILKIKGKLSYNDGRPIVTPSETTDRLAATRRTGGQCLSDPQPQQLATHITICGTTGYNPQEVIRQLMQFVERKTGLTLQDASLLEDAPPSSWRWLAATDPTAPPGRVRLQLENLEQVQSIMTEIHARSLQFGSDLVAVAVQNDLLDAVQPPSGNAPGRQAAART